MTTRCGRKIGVKTKDYDVSGVGKPDEASQVGRRWIDMDVGVPWVWRRAGLA